MPTDTRTLLEVTQDATLAMAKWQQAIAGTSPKRTLRRRFRIWLALHILPRDWRAVGRP